MHPIELDRGTWTATCLGEAVRLLPKEFQLLETLHRHVGKTLSREQLLDAVWALESPIDRTVDDHVYRLRRKLAAWRDAYAIRTVRGAGYRLEAKAAPAERRANPLLADPVHAERMRELLDTNLLYGNGDALLALATRPDVFGFELDAPLRSFVPFLEGRFREFVEDRMPFGDRVFFLLHLFHLMKPRESRPYVEAALRQRVMPDIWHTEVELYNIIFMLMDWGETDAAAAKLEKLWPEALDGEYGNLVPYLANLRLESCIFRKRWDEAEREIERIEQLMRKYPFQREEGRFAVLSGLALYRERPEAGLERIDDGLATLRRTRFVPHLAGALDAVLRYAAAEGKPSLANRYRPEWERLLSDTEMLDVLPAIEAELRKLL
ncbi:winged helix-turn-helix domain-containing protein [Paenibacillus sp.]|uniref:winged helix-turn-helix domain-containing protein n=1 Tax=Paenibacillus sp. TaxID=58172 RepID=UPI002810A2FD|nr:winged helix-turn-helix domain-containing protein [Paenibacillus sp.]